MTPPSQTVAAMPARDVTFADDKIAVRETFHVLTDKIDNADKFVADGHRHGDRFCAQASQLYMWTSVPQIDVFVTRMSTSSVPTLGIGTSLSHNPGSARLFTTACIVFCTRKKLSES